MRLEELSKVLQKLLEDEVRFLVAGGLAVVAHGHARVTHDLDLVVALESANVDRALRCLETMAFRPRIPVSLMDFADSTQRAEWVKQRNLQVFSLTSARYRTVVLDIFAEVPFDFAVEWERACWIAFPCSEFRVPFVSKTTLIRMKQAAGRAIDQDDLEALGGVDG